MSEGNSVPFLQLADLVQSVSSQNQSGTLSISEKGQYRIVFRNGQIVACTDPRGGALYRAMQWLSLLDSEKLSPFMSGDISDIDDDDLAQIVLGQGLIEEDGLRDAIDIIIEEIFTEILGWQKPDMQFAIDGDVNGWEQFQINIGTAIPASGLLMEGLRRQDEMSRFAHLNLIHDGNDILIADNMSDEAEAKLDEQAVVLWENWDDSKSINENLLAAHVPPWQGVMTLAILQQEGSIREPTPAELIVLANNLQSHDILHKEMMLRKAIKLGADNGRIHLTLADLALARKSQERACKDLLAAAEALQTQEPEEAVKALHRILELNKFVEQALQKLVHIYRNQNNNEQLPNILLKLALFDRDAGKIEEATQAANEARELGADILKCEQILADCAIKQYDKEQALMHLELAAEAAKQRELNEDHIAILQQIIGISPGNIYASKAYAEYLYESNQIEAAKTILQQALNDPRKQLADDEIVQLRELVAQIDPSDTANHDWLAHFYQENENRVAASAQLLRLAEAQEQEGRLQDLTDTLARIIDMAGAQTPILIKQARLQAKLGYDSKSIRTYDAVITKLTNNEKYDEAKTVADEALAQFPSCKELHIRRGKLANREADRNTAIDHYRAAAQIAMGSRNFTLARKLFHQLLVLQPEDVLMRCQLADISAIEADDDDDEMLHTLIRLAVKSNNLGIALERARQRVKQSPPPAFDARSELIEILRRCNRSQEEKQEGLKLFNDLISEGDYERALEFLERLVASTGGQDAILVYQLAELYDALEQKRQAIRYYRHSVVLFQQEERKEEALQSLNQLLELTDNAEDIQEAIESLNNNQAINWEVIRTDVQTRKHGSKSYRKSESSIIRMNPGTGTHLKNP